MPLIYNGQELGGEQILNYFTDSKINWNNKDTKMYNTVKVLAEMKHKVKAFKDGLTASERGSVNWIKYDGQVAAYVRRNGNSEAMVVLNLGGETDVTLSGVREGKYIQWIDSSTIVSYISKKDIINYLSYDQ